MVSTALTVFMINLAIVFTLIAYDVTSENEKNRRK